MKLQPSAPLCLVQSGVFTLLINTVNSHAKVQSLMLLVNHWLIGVTSGVMLTCVFEACKNCSRSKATKGYRKLILTINVNVLHLSRHKNDIWTFSHSLRSVLNFP